VSIDKSIDESFEDEEEKIEMFLKVVEDELNNYP